MPRNGSKKLVNLRCLIASFLLMKPGLYCICKLFWRAVDENWIQVFCLLYYIVNKNYLNKKVVVKSMLLYWSKPRKKKKGWERCLKKDLEREALQSRTAGPSMHREWCGKKSRRQEWEESIAAMKKWVEQRHMECLGDAQKANMKMCPEAYWLLYGNLETLKEENTWWNKSL